MTYSQYQAQAELKANRAAQDIVLRERHAAFDLQAQDKTPKSARFRFSVVGEGSRTSQESYRRQYDRIFACRHDADPPSDLARPGVVAAR